MCEWITWQSSELQSVTNEMLVNTWQETDYGLDMCCATNGAHIEMYWAHEL